MKSRTSKQPDQFPPQPIKKVGGTEDGVFRPEAMSSIYLEVHMYNCSVQSVCIAVGNIVLIADQGSASSSSQAASIERNEAGCVYVGKPVQAWRV